LPTLASGHGSAGARPERRVAAAAPGLGRSPFVESGADGGDPWSWFSILTQPVLLLEQYAWLEFLDLLGDPVYFGVGVPRGNGSPVLCLPGLLGSDSYLGVLRGWLQSIGYRAYPADLGIAAGSPFVLIERALARADRVATETNQRLTLIGHSLGGIISRTMARLRPDLIAHVVTLGSALGPGSRSAAHPLVREMAHLLLRESRSAAGLRTERMLEQTLFCAPVPASVRVTCIYSHQDAVVDWRACHETAPQTTAYAVHGTHTGLAWNGEVYRLLGKALASPERDPSSAEE
jgi:triacylglycerol lipase